MRLREGIRKEGVSIVIPLYNESARVADLIRQASIYLSKNRYDEVILSDDGSVDDTVLVALNLIKNKRIRVLMNKHQGKWGALRSGFFAAEKPVVAFLDCDLSVGFDEINRNFCLLVDVVVGNRYGCYAVDYPLERKFFSRGFSMLVRLLTNVGEVVDPQCPMKMMFKDSDMCGVMYSLQERGFVGDVELFVLVKQWNLAIQEVPVQYVFRQGNFNIMKNTVRMFKGLIRLWIKYYW